MKHEFDKLEIFRSSLNALTQINCNVSDVYDREQAVAKLQRLAKEWHMDEDHVIVTMMQMAQSEADARLRSYVQQTAEKLGLLIAEDDFREKWASFSAEDKDKLVELAISTLETLKKEG